MGTRSITVVKDNNDNKIIEMYKQYDGYPKGMGQELLKFIKSGKSVKGIPIGDNNKMFNGIECFAAQLVEHFKDGTGGIYLHAPITNYANKKKYADTYGAEYYYEIDSNLNLRCWGTYDNKKISIKEN